MSDRGLIHYQPVTGPVWREPVAAALAWLPTGQPAVLRERRVQSESVYPPFYELYKPELLHWVPSGRWPVIAEIRKLGDFQQPPFDALYKPEGLQWLFEGQLWARGIAYAIQSSWTVDPTALIPPAVAFDPQFFPFATSGAPFQQTLPRALQSVFDSPPLPPGPDVIVPDTGLGGSNARHPRRVVYERPDKRKPPTFIDEIGKPVDLLKEALAPETVQSIIRAEIDTTAVQTALRARVPDPEPFKPVILPPSTDEDDDDLLLLS